MRISDWSSDVCSSDLYVIRFLAISIGGIEAGLARIPPSMEQASRLLGETSTGTLRRIHLPLLRPALGAAALLVFVDTMKELPATLLLRPNSNKPQAREHLRDQPDRDGL